MEMPKLVYHGTFWPDNKSMHPKSLETDFGYVSATPDKKWARYFSMSKRWFHREESGNLLLYTIDTEKLPQQILGGCVPPGEPDTRPGALDDDEWVQDRIKMQEWRISYIPQEAIINLEKEHRDAEPTLDLLTVSLYQPE